jgi:uncharacterized membrane protein YcaP (DUF421 family)
MGPDMWHHIIYPDISILEKLIRPVLVYFFLIAGLRLAGKRELAQLNAFDLVVLLTLSNTVQNAIIGNDNSVTGGLVGATALLLVNYVFVRFMYSHETLDRAIEGQPAILMDHGQVLKDNLKKELITMSELEEAAHKQGFSSLDLIDRAILEPGGALCFFAKQPPPEETRYQEILKRLDALSSELAGLRSTN